jgi:ParB/RepB/Spo0J family partition protein
MELRRVRLVDLELSLGRLRLLPEGAIQAKMESMRSKGQLSPLVAAEKEGVLVLVDGFQRLRAASRLGLETVLVEVVTLSPTQMKAQVYLRNRERGLFLLEECRLVRELIEVDGLTQVQVGDLLDRHKSWVCRRLALMRDLSPNLLEDWSLGLLGEGSLRRLTQLQPRNQEELWAVIRKEEMSGREAGLVMDLWRRAPDAESRRYVMENPREAVRLALAKGQDRQDARLGPGGQEVLKGLEVLRQVALRLVRRLREGIEEVTPEGMAILGKALSHAKEDCAMALEVTAANVVAPTGGDK